MTDTELDGKLHVGSTHRWIACAAAALLFALPVEAKHPAMRYDSWYQDYTQAFVTKIYMRSKNRPVEQTATNLDQAMDLIRVAHERTGGMHQIIYLVGWQYEGHDAKWPSWDVVGPQCRSKFSDDPLTSLRTAIRVAKEKYNCELSLHLNMNHACTDSPLWKEYLDKKLLTFRKDGKPKGSDTMIGISHKKEWQAGYAQKRIDGLLAMIPELKATKTIHIDALYSHSCELDNISLEEDGEYIKKIVDYWHAKGIDVTTEFLTDEGMAGYFPLLYHFNLDERQRLKYPDEVVTGGDNLWNGRLYCDYWKRFKHGYGPLLSSPAGGCCYDEAWGIGNFCDLGSHYLAGGAKGYTMQIFRTALLHAWMTRHPVVKHEMTGETYSVHRRDGVVAEVRMKDRHLVVKERGRVVADGTDWFLDQPWNGGRILAASQCGMDREWTLPDAWKTVPVLVGTRYPGGAQVSLPTKDGKVWVKLGPGESLVLGRPTAVGAEPVAKALPIGTYCFNPHHEHKGAKGTLSVTNGIYEMRYDFSGGGHGVGIDFTMKSPIWAEKISFDAQVGKRQHLAILVCDSENQWFYKHAGGEVPGTWSHYEADVFSGWLINWGGRRDGIVRPPLKIVSVNVDRHAKGSANPEEVGVCQVKNIAYTEVPEARRFVINASAASTNLVHYLISDFKSGADRFSAGPRVFSQRVGDYRDGSRPITDGCVTCDLGKGAYFPIHNEIPVWGRPAEYRLSVEAPAEAAGMSFELVLKLRGMACARLGRLDAKPDADGMIRQTFAVKGDLNDEKVWRVGGDRKQSVHHRNVRVMQVVAHREVCKARRPVTIRYVKLEAVIGAGAVAPSLLATPPKGDEAPRQLEVAYLNLDDVAHDDAGVRVTIRDWNGNSLGTAEGRFPTTRSGARSKTTVALPVVAAGHNYVQYVCELRRRGFPDGRAKPFETSWTRPWRGEGTREKHPELPWGFGVYIHRTEDRYAFPSGYETPTNEAAMAEAEIRASMARKAGLKWERLELKPAQVTVPGQKGVYDFSAYDRLLDIADRNGLSCYILLSHYWPVWYKGYTKEAMDEWAKIAGMAVRRWKDRCRHWEIWNEANIHFWKGTVEQYVYLCNRAYDEIKAADPTAEVLAVSTAGVDVGYMDKCIAAGMKYDTISIHPYRQEPFEEPFLEDLAATTNRTHGAKTFLTELGWPTGLDQSTYTERVQAGYFVRNYLTAAGSGNVVAINGYNFFDDGFNVLERENNFGIVRRDLTIKPAYRALATVCSFFNRGEAKLEKRELSPVCRAWIFRMGGRSAVWTTAEAKIRVKTAAAAKVFDPMGVTLGEGQTLYTVGTGPITAVLVDGDVTSVELDSTPVSGTKTILF